MSTIEKTTARRPYALPNDAGVTDLWLPFVTGVSRTLDQGLGRAD
jgi:hypothetical protein